jgi:hypothetical protein
MNTRILWISLFFILFSFDTGISQMSHKVNFLIDEIVLAKCKGEDGVVYDKIKLKDWDYIREIGKPELPIKIVRLLIPKDQDVDIVSADFAGTIEKKDTYFIFPKQPEIR